MLCVLCASVVVVARADHKGTKNTKEAQRKPGAMTLEASLFLKIFLWFGAALLTVVVGTFLIGELLRPEPFHEPMRRQLDAALNGYAQKGPRFMNCDGEGELIWPGRIL